MGGPRKADLKNRASKKCTKCKNTIEISGFYSDKTRIDGKSAKCKNCCSTQALAWYRKNRFTRQYAYRLKTYGLSKEEVDNMVEAQNGRCAACGNLPTPRGLVVDHNHTTGKVRALLCHNCNSSIGYLKDDPNRVLLLFNYLNKYEEGEKLCFR